MRVTKFALAVLTACFTLNASAEMTAAQYKKWAHADNNSIYAAYITGTINAFGWANGDLVSRKQPQLFCPPERWQSATRRSIRCSMRSSRSTRAFPTIFRSGSRFCARCRARIRADVWKE